MVADYGRSRNSKSTVLKAEALKLDIFLIDAALGDFLNQIFNKIEEFLIH